ncbi:MAG: hypothetical protein ABFS18_06505 [Thermodesulfobacteriota bacterium]
MSYKTQPSKKLSLRTIKHFLAIIALLVVAGCSGGDIPPPASTGATGATGGGAVTVGDLTMGALTFTDPVLSPYGNTEISVTVLDSGVPVATSIPVDFTSDCVERGDATITTTANTVTGTATAAYTDNGCGGNDTVTASIVDGPSNTGTLTVTPLTLSALTFGSNPLPALGTTSVSVTLLDGLNNYTAPAIVEFDSQCATAGLATITSTANTIGGVAKAIYTDLGCNNVDTINVSVPGLNNVLPTSGTLTVNQISMPALSFADPILSAYGTTTITAEVFDDDGVAPKLTTIPITVNFSSTCATNGNATITQSATTAGGVATAIFTDNGCGGADTITASITNGPTVLGYFAINPLTFSPIRVGTDPDPLPAFTTTTVEVTLLDGTNNYTTPLTVEFESTCAAAGRAAISPSTLAFNGVATAIYSDNGCQGTDFVTVTVPSLNNGPAITGAINITPLTMGTMTFDSDPDPLSAYGTTQIRVPILIGTDPNLSPVAVNFTSTCANAGLATISQTVTSSGGTATATFTDNGCGSTDNITASIVNGPTELGSLAINPLTFSPIRVGTDPDPLPAFATTTVEVTLLDGTANYTTPLTVDFTSFCADLLNPSLATITKTVPVSGGVATALYVDEGCQGDVVTVTVPSLNNGPTITRTLEITPLAMGTMTFDSDPDPLSPYGTNQIHVPILIGTDPNLSPVAVNFTSTCANAGKGTISETVTSSNGTATATFTDNGCGATDTITASITNGPSTSGQFDINVLTMSALSFGTEVAPDLPPYQSTTVSVTLLEGTADYTLPTAVNFSSFCADQGWATITPNVSTSGGTATATYVDNGCPGDDQIEVTVPSLANGPSQTGTLPIVPLTMGSVSPGLATISANASTSLTVTLKVGADNYLTPTVVDFTSICVQQGKATITPAQTNTTGGVATAIYKDQGCLGDDLITATLPDINNGPSSTGMITVEPLTLDPMSFGVSTVSAYGTTTAEVAVKSGGALITTPVIVNFSSLCAGLSPAQATISASVVTHNGLATATYTDNGCNGDDQITASITDGPSVSATLAVSAPDVGSLQYISATPTTIALKGVGGDNTSQVKFKVVDFNMNPIANQPVDFTLTTSIGGLYLTNASGITNIAGEVDAIVNSGTIGTPVRVTASTLTADGTTTIYSQSEQLWVSTGLPDQDSFSLVASTWRPAKFWESAGETITLSIIASDHFNNPVKDGTTIFFTTECGQIDPSCQTAGGACTVQYKSDDGRPADGNCGILAYAIGEESFVDSDGDGLADLGEFTNLGEPWLDADDSGGYTAGELYLDYDGNTSYSTAAADPKFNGILCNDVTGTSTPGSCSSRDTTYVYRNPVVYWPTANVGTFTVTPAPFALTDCTTVDDWTLIIEDDNGGPMATDTTFALANGASGLVEIVGLSTFTTTDAETNAAGNKTQFDFQTIGSASCAAAAPTSDSIEVTVTPPGGTPQTHVFNVTIP